MGEDQQRRVMCSGMATSYRCPAIVYGIRHRSGQTSIQRPMETRARPLIPLADVVPPRSLGGLTLWKMPAIEIIHRRRLAEGTRRSASPNFLILLVHSVEYVANLRNRCRGFLRTVLERGS